MKTLKIFFVALIFCIATSWTSTASVVHVQLDETYNPEWHYFCGVDSIILHKPTNAINNIYWDPPTGPTTHNVDSAIVTSANTGMWSFSSDEVFKDFYIYILSSGPTEPTCMLTDTSFCTSTFLLPLDAQNQLPGGYAATYEWSTGATTRTITVTTPGTYTVTITNACGTEVYSKNVTQSNPNAPYLGADQTFCWGSTSVLDPGSSDVDTYQWSTGETTPTITVDTTGTYWVYLVDDDGCSGRDTIFITALIPTPEDICFVEFDTTTWKNNINWTSNLPGSAEFVDVYKEVSLNVWDLIGTVPVGTTNFIDVNSTPQSNSNSYAIAVVDTCGNESSMSSPHTTITLISSYNPLNNEYGFSWSAYLGLTVADYFLFGIDSNNAVTQIASVPGNIYMYNYSNPNPAFVKYYVGFETPDCNGSKADVMVKSNWVDQDPSVTAMREENIIPFSVYPNPADDQLNLTIDCKDFQVEISTMLGQVLLSEQNAKALNVGILPQGIYIISITADGIKSNLRFIKN